MIFQLRNAIFAENKNTLAKSDAINCNVFASREDFNLNKSLRLYHCLSNLPDTNTVDSPLYIMVVQSEGISPELYVQWRINFLARNDAADGNYSGVLNNILGKNKKGKEDDGRDCNTIFHWSDMQRGECCV